jgi:hypothetical protein
LSALTEIIFVTVAACEGKHFHFLWNALAGNFAVTPAGEMVLVQSLGATWLIRSAAKVPQFPENDCRCPVATRGTSFSVEKLHFFHWVCRLEDLIIRRLIGAPKMKTDLWSPLDFSAGKTTVLRYTNASLFSVG